MNGKQRAEWLEQAQAEADSIAAEWQVPKWEVRWSHRLRTARGRAYLGRGYMVVSESIPTQEELRNTFLHECAHMVAYAKYRDRGHGDMWRRVFFALGGDGRRTYSGKPPKQVAAERLEERGLAQPRTFTVETVVPGRLYTIYRKEA